MCATAPTGIDRCAQTELALHQHSRRIVLESESIVSVLTWIALGLVSGFVASKIINKSGDGFLLDIALGIVGAVVGGWLFAAFGMAGASGLNVYSFIVAIAGAMAVLVGYHLLVRSSR